MKTAKWSDLLRPMARKRCAILLARASNCPCVIVSPDWAMMIAGWLGSAVKSCSIGPPLLFVLSTLAQSRRRFFAHALWMNLATTTRRFSLHNQGWAGLPLTTIKRAKNVWSCFAIDSLGRGDWRFDGRAKCDRRWRGGRRPSTLRQVHAASRRPLPRCQERQRPRDPCARGRIRDQRAAPHPASPWFSGTRLFLAEDHGSPCRGGISRDRS